MTAAIGDKESPLRQYFERRFADARPLQRDYRDRSAALLVRPDGADPATLGSAFDLAVRFELDHDAEPEIALLGFVNRLRELAVVDAVLARAQAAARRGDGAELDRACWALALCVDVYRAGWRRDSALAGLLRAGRFTPEGLLSLAPTDGLRQLEELRAIAARDLVPRLRAPVRLGPTFDGSALCAADADLIADGVLIDIKTRLGPRNARTGERYDSLPRRDIYQLLGYLFFDSSDAYRIESFGIYSARYGSLITWPVGQALQTLADGPVDLAGQRRTVRRLLSGGSAE